MTTFTAHIRDGKIVPDQPVHLPEGVEVQVTISPTTPADEAGETFLERHRRILEQAWELPKELARDIDDVVYGDPHHEREQETR